MKPFPPHIALKFLRWFCREDYLEEIEGDLTELYEKHYEQSAVRAKWKFAWSVIRYFRPGFIKSFKTSYHPNTIAMLRHNFLLTYRNFKRYRSSFFINLIGLSSGLACALLIYLWVNDELSVDNFYENDRQLYQVMEHLDQAHGIWTSSSTAGPMAASLVDEMPEVEYAAVTGMPATNVNLSVDDNNVRANGHYVSQDYFKMFSYNFIQGDKKQGVSDKNAIAISEELAIKLFNTSENIIGSPIRFQHDRQFFISAVFETFPLNSSERFDFILSYEVYEDMYPSVLEWRNSSNRVYLILKTGTKIEEFNDKIADYIKVKTDNGVTFRTPFVKRYTEKYLYGKYKNGVEAGGRIEYVRLFSIIAIFILAIACINFMNLSTAKASRRLKEVGIKKAVGARRKSLIFQHLGESLTMAFLSFISASALVFLFLPQFNEITGKQLVLNIDLSLMLLVFGITLFTGLVSGSYPAFYLSGFSPVAVLEGKIDSARGGVLARKGLVVFQFVISVILIVAVLIVFKQIEFIQTKNLGYSKDNIL